MPVFHVSFVLKTVRDCMLKTAIGGKTIASGDLTYDQGGVFTSHEDERKPVTVLTVTVSKDPTLPHGPTKITLSSTVMRADEMVVLGEDIEKILGKDVTVELA